MTGDSYSKYNINNLLFYIFSFGGVICNIAGFIADFLAYGFKYPSIIYLVMVVLFTFFGIFGAITKERYVSTVIMLLAINFIEFPFIFYVYGVNSLVFLMLGIVAIVIFLGPKAKMIVTPLTVIVFVITFILSYRYPQKLIEFEGDRYWPAVISYCIAGAILFGLSSMLVAKYHNEIAFNKSLTDRLASISKRDSLTKTFSHDFGMDYIKSILDSGKQFMIACYKITSYEHIKNKYGEQFCDVGVVSLSEILIAQASNISMISRYSDSTFIVVFNHSKDEEIDNALFEINDSLYNGLTKTMNIINATVISKDGDTPQSIIDRLGARVGGLTK